VAELKLSIVVPTKNRRELLARTLPTVLGQDLPKNEYEVVIVSDGSTDGTREFVAGLKTARARAQTLERSQR
jgi:glycosyltransferase involved in cell wall biosynthesis